jgi:hypothetical protein
MSDRARFIGGPKDGEAQDVTLQAGSPPQRLRLPMLRRLDPVAHVMKCPTPDSEPVDMCGPQIAEYRLHLDATGHPSRTEDGALRYIFQGES